MRTLPIISLAGLAKADEQEIQRLYDSCYELGFFYLTDHGVGRELVDKTIEVSRKFFELPKEVKLNYRQALQEVHPKTCRGYVPLLGEFLNEETGFDPKEIFDLGIDKPLSEEPFVGPTLLPDEETAPGFAATHFELQREIMGKVTPTLLKGLALALNLEENWFDRFFGDPVLIQRAICYPAGEGRAGKHTDNGIFTILIQEYFPTPSLRVYAQDEWIDAPCIENALVVNLGDMLQLWTKSLFVSTPHEVIHKNLNESRISIPFFVYPSIDTLIKPFETEDEFSSKEIMLKNFSSIWETHEGAGRANELVK
jgi:isopenicillin N synthase-like dioxygenase